MQICRQKVKQWLTEAWRGWEVGSKCFMGTEFQSGKMEHSRDGWWGRLHSDVNAFDSILCTLENDENGKFRGVQILPQFKKRIWSILMEKQNI